MIKLSKGQTAVLIVAATPMAAVGIAGAVATYANMVNVLHRSASALGLVAAGEGATLIAALVALAVTLMGQHTPTVVRLAMWVIPLVASGTGVALAPTQTDAVTMAVTPLAMTAAGEGVAFVARRVVAYRTGVDIEQQRRAGLLLWHAHRAANGSGFARRRSELAVMRLTKQVAATDGQLSVQLGEIQRYRIAEGADANLATVLGNGPERPSLPPVAPAPSLPPAAPREAVSEPHKDAYEGTFDPGMAMPTAEPEDNWDFVQGILSDADSYAEQAPALLTGDQVAERLNVSPQTVRSYVHRGKGGRRLPVADKDARGRSLFRPEDVDLFA